MGILRLAASASSSAQKLLVAAAFLAALGALSLAPGVARAETLKYEVQLFGVEVGELTANIEGSKIRLIGETSGALVLFFPAKEDVVIETAKGKPSVITRSFEHGGKKGVWKLTFRKGEVELHRDDDKIKDETRTLKVKGEAYDPATALQELRRRAPAKSFSMAVFGPLGIYRFSARRVGTKPLHYRGTFKLVTALRKKMKKRPRLPPWFVALGLGKGATKNPELNVWLSDDDRKLPTRIRMTDRIGSLELFLTEPVITQAKNE